MNIAKLLEGSLEMLILRALRKGSLDAYGIIDELQKSAGEPLLIEIAMLHPILYRLETSTMIAGIWRKEESGTRRMQYSLTERGHTRLHEYAVEWRDFVDLVERVLEGGVTASWA